MTSIAKTLAVAILIAAGAASAQAGKSAVVDGCKMGTITPHGVWDCR